MFPGRFGPNSEDGRLARGTQRAGEVDAAAAIQPSAGRQPETLNAEVSADFRGSAGAPAAVRRHGFTAPAFAALAACLARGGGVHPFPGFS